MKCCDRPATHSVKTLLDHPDIDVNIRDKVRPLIMRFFFEIVFSLEFCVGNLYAFLVFPYCIFQNGRSALDRTRDKTIQDILREYSK